MRLDQQCPRSLLLPVLLVAVLVGACSSGGDPVAPTTTVPDTVPPPTEAPVTTAPRPTTTLPGEPRTTTTLSTEIAPGGARISGTVVGPQGALAGAVIRVERIVGDHVASMEINAANGQFNLPSIRGGRYLVRAWKQPDYYQPVPEGFFLAADEQKSLELRVTRVGEVNADTTIEPTPLPRTEPFSITIFLYAGSVSRDGFLQANPRAGQEVQIALGPGLGLNGPDRMKTDSGGKATFSARCRTPGPQSAELRVSVDVRLPLGIPECRPPA